MKRTIAMALLVLAIAAVGCWGAMGWLQQNRETRRLQTEYAQAEETRQTLQQEKGELERQLDELTQQNTEQNETLQSWRRWNEELQRLTENG